jgi:phospholipase C
MVTRKWFHCILALMVGASPFSSMPLRASERDDGDAPTTTPIKHVVVIFQENVSFDHYFGTYPFALNPGGEPEFHAKNDTPSVNNLFSSGLLDHNPNGVNPFRIDRSVPVTCDEDHN